MDSLHGSISFLYHLALSLVGVVYSLHHLVHRISVAPGIEPGNLIRSTLIRYHPGPAGNKVTCVTEQNRRKHSYVQPMFDCNYRH